MEGVEPLGGEDIGQPGFGLVGLIVSMAIPTGTNTGTDVTLLGVPSGAADVLGAPAGASGSGASPAVPGGLIPQSADTAAQESQRTALAVVDQAAIAAGGHGSLDASSVAGAVRGTTFSARGHRWHLPDQPGRLRRAGRRGGSGALLGVGHVLVRLALKQRHALRVSDQSFGVCRSRPCKRPGCRDRGDSLAARDLPGGLIRSSLLELGRKTHSPVANGSP
jgi:hypothetical protein